jgi:hypothetical protein
MMGTTDATGTATGAAATPARGKDARVDRHEWIGLPEAAVAAGLSRFTLARAAKDGNLQTRRTGKIWLTTPALVDAWLKAARHRPGPHPGHGVGRPRRRPTTPDPGATAPATGTG